MNVGVAYLDLKEMADEKFAFDLSNYKDDERKALKYLARFAEQAERYDDMASLMKKLVKWTSEQKKDLTVEERNLLSVAYKNVIGVRRASWRTLNEGASHEDEKFQDLVTSFKARVEAELEEVCSDVVELLQDYLVKNSETNGAEAESKVFYLKMLGDYWRYRAEYKKDTKFGDKSSPEWSAHYYEIAFQLAEKELEPTHPIRLGLALNYSVCY